MSEDVITKRICLFKTKISHKRLTKPDMSILGNFGWSDFASFAWLIMALKRQILSVLTSLGTDYSAYKVSLASHTHNLQAGYIFASTLQYHAALLGVTLMRVSGLALPASFG